MNRAPVKHTETYRERGIVRLACLDSSPRVAEHSNDDTANAAAALPRRTLCADTPLSESWPESTTLP
jgi:hypothetical protein